MWGGKKTGKPSYSIDDTALQLSLLFAVVIAVAPAAGVIAAVAAYDH